MKLPPELGLIVNVDVIAVSGGGYNIKTLAKTSIPTTKSALLLLTIFPTRKDLPIKRVNLYPDLGDERID